MFREDTVKRLKFLAEFSETSFLEVTAHKFSPPPPFIWIVSSSFFRSQCELCHREVFDQALKPGVKSPGRKNGMLAKALQGKADDNSNHNHGRCYYTMILIIIIRILQAKAYNNSNNWHNNSNNYNSDSRRQGGEGREPNWGPQIDQSGESLDFVLKWKQNAFAKWQRKLHLKGKIVSVTKISMISLLGFVLCGWGRSEGQPAQKKDWAPKRFRSGGFQSIRLSMSLRFTWQRKETTHDHCVDAPWQGKDKRGGRALATASGGKSR